MIHAFLDGVSFFVADLLSIRIGNSFSGGLIDFFLFGILQGNHHTNWLLVLPVGVAWAAMYYVVFRFFVTKFKVAVPGMIDEEELTSDSSTAPSSNNSLTDEAQIIIDALGGAKNIESVTACATRLRVAITNTDQVDKQTIKSLGATAVVEVSGGIQAIFGGKSDLYNQEISEILGLED